MKIIVEIIRGITFIFCMYTLLNIKNSSFFIIILSFWILFEMNIFWWNEPKRRSLNIYKNNIILTLSIIILIFLNFENSEPVIVNLRSILLKYLNVNLKSIYEIIIIILSVCLVIFSFLNIFKKEKIYFMQSNLLTFRKKELDKIKTYINDDDIQTILLDGKMGNGKTEIIENLINNFDGNKVESIYLKLPLLEDINELKKTVILELKNIFNKYGINSNYLNDFLGKVSVLKTNFFEFNFNGANNNNWNNIQILKNNLKKLLEDKKIRVLIILDDIEREEDSEKIKKSIYFLGELSEYFRGTKATIIFLAQYEKVIENLNNKSDLINKILLEKYFSYIMKIEEVDLEKFTVEDIKLLIGDKIYNKNISKEYFETILLLLTEFSKICKSLEIDCNESVRTIKKFLKQMKWMALWKKYKSTSWLTISIMNLIITFLNDEIPKKDINKLKEILFDKMMNNFQKKIKYNFVKEEINKIEKKLKKGKDISEEFEINLEKAIKVIEENCTLDREITLNYFERIVIFDYIGNNTDKLEIFLKNKFDVSKESLLEKIIDMKIDNLNFLSEYSKQRLESFLLKKELSYLEARDLEDEIKAEFFYEDIKKEIEQNKTISEKIDDLETNLVKRNKAILNLLSKDNNFVKSYTKIEQILEQDLSQELNNSRYILEQEED